jgi:two-component system chemotaxis response regulator CheB
MAYRIVVFGSSWGGLDALGTILPALPPDFPAAIAVAQHRQPKSSDGLAAALSRSSTLPVVDAADKDEILPGRVYLAPPDYHLLVERGSLALSTDEPVMFARPSIDVLFESAAASYGGWLVAVILTGANEDGAAGAAAVKRNGGLVIVQDPSTAIRPEMPRATLASVTPDAVLPLADIGAHLASLGAASILGARGDE